MPFCCKAGFKTGGAVTVVARPRFGAIQIATAASRVRVLDFQELEVFFPIRAFLREWRPAVANLNPLHSTILELACLSHISEVFIAGDRPFPQGSVFDRSVKLPRLSGLHFCSHEISHENDCKLRQNIVQPLVEGTAQIRLDLFPESLRMRQS